MKERGPARIAALVVALVLGGSTAGRAGESLTLRVEDTTARPGKRVAVVFRTYQPQPVSQGQVCFFGRPLSRGLADSPFEAIEKVVVWSETGDAIVTSATMTGGAVPEIELAFHSAASGINTSDGPMVLVVLRLADDVTIGESIEIGIDSSATFLLDAQGDSLPLDLRAGEVEVIAPGTPFELALESEPVPAGLPADVFVTSEEALVLDRAELALHYDPAPFVGLPQIDVDPRYGDVTVAVHGSPGDVVLSVHAVTGPIGWGEVPGDLLRVRLTPKPSTVAGAWQLHFDPRESFVLIDDMSPPPVVLVDGMIRLLPPGAIFVDGFDDGSTDGWTEHAP